MICSLNRTFTEEVVNEDLISASVYGPARNTGYVANLASRHKTWLARWERHNQVLHI